MNTEYEIIEVDGYYELLNKISNTVTNFKFTEIKSISNLFFSCCKEKDYYLLTYSAKIISKDSQQHYEYFAVDKILTKRNNKYGFIDFKNRVTIPFKYDEIIPNENIFNVRINDMWGIMNLFGKEISHIKYREPVVYTEKKIAFVIDTLSGMKGVLNFRGEEIIPTIYSFIVENYNNPNYLFVAIEGMETNSRWNFFSEHISYATWGCFDINGRLIVPVNYDCIKIKDNYLYAGWQGNFLPRGQGIDCDCFPEYSGIYDLYSNNGNFLVGGFDLFHAELDVLFFHFSGNWKSECDEYGYSSYEFETWKGKWVMTDKNLNSLIKINNQDSLLSETLKIEKA